MGCLKRTTVECIHIMSAFPRSRGVRKEEIYYSSSATELCDGPSRQQITNHFKARRMRSGSDLKTNGCRYLSTDIEAEINAKTENGVDREFDCWRLERNEETTVQGTLF